MQMARHKRSERGITLVEMIVVVAIAVIMMRLLLPAFKGLGGSKQSFAATTQFIGDLSTARLMAMNNGSPVYVVFMPPASYINSKYFYEPLENKDLATPPSDWPPGNDWPPNPRPYFELPDGGNPRLGGQLVSYAFYAGYDLNDSLGGDEGVWLSDWKQLPEGAFFPSEMLKDLGVENIRYSIDKGEDPLLIPHVRNGGSPRVVALSVPMRLPYIGFDERGQVIGVRHNLPDNQPVRGAIIRLVEGGVLQPDMNSSVMDDRKFLVVDPATGKAFDADEPLNIGRAENYVLINFLTGRARTTVIKAVPAGNKLVKVRIIRFTDRLWKWNDPITRDGSIGFGEFLKDNRSGGDYSGAWEGDYLPPNDKGQRVLRAGVVAPDVIVNIQAKLASKLQEEVLRVDPDADLLIME
jgi:type II secretory pathway pseudopilin PulG